ncbi:MAG: insulinase family protein [Pseudomonadales bacterium]|nr:insulinase family protein [Pseudomonadales bacterium]
MLARQFLFLHQTLLPVVVGLTCLVFQTHATAQESVTAQIFDIEYYELDNGIPVISHKRHNNDRFSIQLVADVGLQDFPCEDRHLPHVVEHVLFEETKTFDGQAFRKRIYDKGGFWEGYTSDEYTHYTVHIHKAFTDIAIDTLYRMINEPTLSEKATANAIRTVNTERGTTTGGLQNWINDDLTIQEQGKNRLYPGTNIDCKKRHNPNHITVQQVTDVFHKHYIPANLTVMVLGQFDAAKVKTQLQQSFGTLKHKTPPLRTAINEGTIDYTAIEETERYGNPATYLHFFVRAEGKSSPNSLAWQLISLYLSERTFDEIRTQRGIGYSPRALYKAGTNIGHIEFIVRTTSEWYDQVHDLLLTIYSDLKSQGISSDEVERLKKRMLYNFESMERGNQNIFQLYRHNREWIKEKQEMRDLIVEIKALTKQDIDKLVAGMPEQPLVAILRPHALWEAILKLILIVVAASLILLPVYKRLRTKKAQSAI